MPAERTKKHHHGKRPASTGPDGQVRHKVPPLQQRDGLMGVSKLKSAIRQTKRLLAKENIEPGLRVATQRRLTSLEADLAAAEKRSVEKKNGQKYHAVKFFERQKLGRIIKRVVRELGELSGERGEAAEEVEDKDEKKSKKSKSDKTDKSKSKKKTEKKIAELEKQLLHARVMLNYVVNFPNTQKYIALFAEAKHTEDEHVALPTYLDDEGEGELAGPAAQRRDILRETQRLMAAGELPAEPEKEGRDPRRRAAVAAAISKDTSQKKGKKGEDKEEKKDEGEEEDDFFDDE